jgi:hypothetical protein
VPPHTDLSFAISFVAGKMNCAMSITLEILQGWLSPVRPGEHYLATYTSSLSFAISQHLSFTHSCSVVALPTIFHSYASALWAVQAAAVAQAGVLAASYRAVPNH